MSCLRTASAAFVAIAALAGPPAAANEFAPLLEALTDSEIRVVIEKPEIIAAIRAQNAETRGFDGDRIAALDRDWRSQIGKASAPLIEEVTVSEAADLLRSKREASAGLFSEIFVMDAVGLNVAASDVTSDYWQGDEAKWQETYPRGAGAVHIGEVEFDESSQVYQSQISVAIVDPETGEPIGAATFGVNVEYLQ